MTSIAENPLLLAAAFVAGAVNAVAGGGTLLTFPALLAVMGSVEANATSTLALVPGAMAAGWGFRREIQPMRRWLTLLLGPALVGGVIGALLLTRLPSSVFDAAIPWLILTATLLLAAQPLVSRLLARGGDGADGGRGRLGLLALALFQLGVSIYGGYFGAGIGIMMLAALGLMQLSDIHQMNGLKSVLGAATNGISVVVFAWQGVIDWPVALTMAVTAVIGGYLGAHLSRRVNRAYVRGGVVVIGLVLAAHYFWQR